MSEFEGRVAFVTGASRGLGRAIAQAFVNAGAAVALVDLKTDWTEKAAAEIGGTAKNTLALAADVSDRAALQAAVDQTVARFGRLDIVVNNAMWNRYDPIEDVTEDTAQRMIDVGLLGVAWGIQVALPALRKSEGGSIINIGSMAGRLGMTGTLMYSGIKAAVDGMTRAASVELGPDRIRVNAVAPSTVATEGVRAMLDKDSFEARVHSTPLGRLGETEDIAQTVLWLASDRSSFITGQSIAVDGGLGHAFGR